MKYPLIYQIGLNATVACSEFRGLTREQQAAQDELQMVEPSMRGGVVLPFYAQSPETRSLRASSAPAGGYMVGSDIPEIGAALRDALVIERLGARIWGGLQGEATFPLGKPTITAHWLSETADTPDSSEQFDALNLSPKRVSASIRVSNQLLSQREAAESYLRTELMGALAEAVQQKAIAGNGGAEPLGLLNSTGLTVIAGGANGAAPTYATICDLEEAPSGKNGLARYGWLVSPKVRKKLRQTFTNGTGSTAVWLQADADRLLGHPAGVTRGSPDNLTKGTSVGNCSSITFGDFSELFVGFWGPGIHITANPFSHVARGLTEITATAYVDSGVRNIELFVAMRDALAA